MQLRIPNNKLIKTFDALLEIAKPFDISINQNANSVTMTGKEDAMFDFLTAKNDMQTYAIEDMKSFKKTYTPELALQKINEFVLSKGGFDDYDIMFEALNNALHGIV